MEKSEFYDNYGLKYTDCLLLNEHGLLNNSPSQRSYYIEAGEKQSLISCDKLILLTNNTNHKITLSFSVFVLTSVAKELKLVADKHSNVDCLIRLINEISTINKEIDISLHQINFFYEGGVNYKKDNLYTRDIITPNS